MNGNEELNFGRARERIAEGPRNIETGSRSEQDVEKILRQRAALLALSDEPETQGANHSIVIFRLGPARYAVLLETVSEIIPNSRIAPAPGAPPEIAGLMQVRGEIRVVWNMHRLLRLNIPQEPSDNRLTLLLRNSNGELGILVDQVEDIRIVAEAGRQPAPEDADYSRWMTEDLVVVLDMEKLLPGGSKTSRAL